MKHYRINYIDGHDMRYKSFETKAESKEEALDNLWEQYKPFDFDHQIAEIIELKEPTSDGLRIGKDILSSPPVARQVSADRL